MGSCLLVFLSLLCICWAQNGQDQNGHGQCSPGEFECGEGVCISDSWVCDGELDCGSGEDERQSCCAEGKQFECASDGLCIERQYRCDSFSDCDDASDEANCTACASPALFHCTGSHRCVDPVFVCDQDNDCGDFSDELGCDKGKTSTAYKCQNGDKMVDTSRLCDRINDCGDMSDEIGCVPCESFHFQCHNNEKCVLVFDLCDGVAQCSDMSDEYWCETCDAESEFQCSNGRCVPQSRVCNLINDCGDKSDEDHCACDGTTEFECASGIREYFNATNVKCIPGTWVCDKMQDCNEGEDEDTALCETLEPPTPEVIECSAGEFECADGYCIGQAMVCDGIPHCDKGEDEVSCPVRCPRGSYELCEWSSECVSYAQFCDGTPHCSDGSDESYSNGYCICSGVLCGDKCVSIDKVCDSHWDCARGEDEKDCTRCRPNLNSTRNLIDQTIYVINVLQSTYGEIDNFQIYFAALARQWVSLFGEQSPFHLDASQHSTEAKMVVEKTQQFLISIIALRPNLRQFIAVMHELGFTDRQLPKYEELNSIHLNQKRFVIERTDASEIYEDFLKRNDYLRQKATDTVEVLSAVTKTLHYDFSSCQDTKFLLQPNQFKRSMREIFTALTMVQGKVPRSELNEFLDRLYELNEQLGQLIVSVENLDHIIASLAYIMDDTQKHVYAFEDDTQEHVYAFEDDMIAPPEMDNLPNADYMKPSALKRHQKAARDYKNLRTMRLKHHNGKI